MSAELESHERENAVIECISNNQDCSMEFVVRHFKPGPMNKSQKKCGFTMARPTTRDKIFKLKDRGIITMTKSAGRGHKVSLSIEASNPFVIAQKMISEFENQYFPLLSKILRTPRRATQTGYDKPLAAMQAVFHAFTGKMFYMLKAYWLPRLVDQSAKNRLIAQVYVDVARLEVRASESQSRLNAIKGLDYCFDHAFEEREKLVPLHSDLEDDYKEIDITPSIAAQYQKVRDLVKLPEGTGWATVGAKPLVNPV